VSVARRNPKEASDKVRSDDQELYIKAELGRKSLYKKQSPTLPEPQAVDAAVIWNESYRSYRVGLKDVRR
jgi:hypothetical protein